MQPQVASTERQNRAEKIVILEKRRVTDEIWEIDVVNDNGESRENLTVIPSRIYSPSKDMQFRGHKGIVGKYIRALALEDEDARDQLLEAIEERRAKTQKRIRQLKEEESNLLHAQADIQNL